MVDLGLFDGVGLAGGVVLVGVVVGGAVRVEVVLEGEEGEEEVVVEEDDALLVTLKYCDLNRGPLPSEVWYIANQKILLRDRF